MTCGERGRGSEVAKEEEVSRGGRDARAEGGGVMGVCGGVEFHGK